MSKKQKDLYLRKMVSMHPKVYEVLKDAQFRQKKNSFAEFLRDCAIKTLTREEKERIEPWLDK